MRGSPQKVLDAIDEYGRTKNFLMNVGQSKGRIVCGEIAKLKPKVMVELGGYVGYSAILFGDALRAAGGSKYISLELSPKFASVSRALVSIAGLDDIVEVIVGSCRESLRQIIKPRYPEGLDALFFDHRKLDYVNDIKLCEEIGLVAIGTTVLADNVICSGAPDYLKYIRSSTEEKRRSASSAEPQPDKDVSVGNPNLVYDTVLFEGLEPTGQPVSYLSVICSPTLLFGSYCASTNALTHLPGRMGWKFPSVWELKMLSEIFARGKLLEMRMVT